MGNDGGTIARGQDLRAVYGSKKGEEGPKSLDDSEKALFGTCSLTSLPLFENGLGHKVVSDYLGKLYLKEKILELILERKTKSEEDDEKKQEDSSVSHITGLGDVKDLTISWTEAGDIVCPVTGTAKLSHSNLAYLRTCGCVFSNKLLVETRRHFKIGEEVETEKTSQCPVCEQEFTFNYDIVILNPQTEEAKEFNSKNFEYLKRHHMSHTKKTRKRKKLDKSEKSKKRRVESDQK